MEQEHDITYNLTDILIQLGRAAPGILGSAIVSIDGFTIASELPGEVEERKLGAMAAALLGLGEQTVLEFEHNKLERVFVEGEEGYTIVTATGDEAILAVIARKDAKLGLLFLQVGRVAEEVARILSSEGVTAF
jgi:predicted regulator of Ras-like GTPase activity (Roadblock/LC7/MglB family)